MSYNRFSFLVPICQDGLRLDVCVSLNVDYCSRSYASILARRGDIYVNAVSKKPSCKVNKGDAILGFAENKVPEVIAECIPLEVIYEDSDILVINKKAGIVVHPSPGHYSGTVANAVLYLCPDLKDISDTVRPGIVHRLDKDTTGLLVIAKNKKSFLDISFQFKNRIVVKQYLVLVYGVPDKKQGIIDFAIGRQVNNRKKMSINGCRSRSAKTLWKVIKRFREFFSLMEVSIETGRTHQIRVHCQAIGHPVVGDTVYKDRKFSRGLLKNNLEIRNIVSKIERQMLHAHKICFKHPSSKKIIKLEAKLPSDMSRVLKILNSG